MLENVCFYVLSFRYVAPETILARGYNIAVDWWCLGVVTYVLLTGRQPFTRG
jgi:serine/threonine protein kinase